MVDMTNKRLSVAPMIDWTHYKLQVFYSVTLSLFSKLMV